MQKGRRSLKRDTVLLALADAGDIAIEALFQLSAFPIDLMEVMVRSHKYGLSTEIPSSAGYYGGEKGLFRDLAEFRIYIAGLKRQGLISRGKKGHISITVNGRSLLQRHHSNPSFLVRYTADPEASNSLTMVIFDIPEKHNRERDWLRFHLKTLGFRFVQGSVWLGPVGLPKPFIEDIYRYEINKWIHVFPIDRAGTISGLIQRFGF